MLRRELEIARKQFNDRLLKISLYSDENNNFKIKNPIILVI